MPDISDYQTPGSVPSYCNPLPLPDIQRGRGNSRNQEQDYREMADPTVIHFEGKWYLFPSAGMLWRSSDMLAWDHIPIAPFDAGYAPTVVEHGGWLYLTASWDGSVIWRARGPLGPWEKLGERGVDADGNETWLKDENGAPVRWGDPCLFSDDDGSLYCYCNLAKTLPPTAGRVMNLVNDIGIFGVRLDQKDPTRFAQAPTKLISFNPAHWWERSGESNQRLDSPVLEGAWMTKRCGKYYLQYSSNCTEYKNYAVGCYVGETALGPFVAQKRNPVLVHSGGFVNGCGHHSVVPGPDGHLWCFYTTLIRVNHPYERRIAMDPVRFDAVGELYVDGPSESPQWAPLPPGSQASFSLKSPGPGLLPLSVNCPAKASGSRYGREPAYAVDNYIRTWWEADGSDTPQWLEVDLEGEFEVFSARTLFADRGLNYSGGCPAGFYQYRILGSKCGEHWSVLSDQSENHVDRQIAYDKWSGESVRFVRLEILRAPLRMRIGIMEFTVFGLAQHQNINP